MKTSIFKKIGLLLIMAMGLASLAAGPATGAAESGTVLSVEGDVTARPGPDAAWEALRPGATLAGGSQVRAVAGAFALILTPTGDMEKIEGETTATLSFGGGAAADAGEAPADGAGYQAFVAEFFSANARTRINAVRSHLTPLQQDWIAFANFNSLPPDRIEAALQLAAAFQQANAANREVYILWKMTRFYPDNPGVQALAGKAMSAYRVSGRWRVGEGTAVPADAPESREVTTGGEALQVAFASDKESYVYLFDTHAGPDGTVATRRLFPDTEDVMGLENRTFFAARVAAEEVLAAKEDGVEVRSGADPFAPVAGVLGKGQAVTVVEKSGRRYRIETAQGLSGWVLKHKLAGETVTEGKRSGDALAVARVAADGRTHYLWGWSAAGPMPPWAVEDAARRVEAAIKAADPSPASVEKAVADGLPGICGAVTAMRVSRR